MANKETLRSDFCVVGAGAGGLSFAAGAVQMGASVILLEHKKMGGDCLHTGCVPSKALLAAAKAGHGIREAHRFGWNTTSLDVDFQKVHDHIHRVIQNIAPHDSIERFQGLGVRVIIEKGTFLDAHILETENHRIQAKRFILATGSSPFVPPIPGITDIPYHTNETIFHLKKRPDHLLVIGGGPIGMEMAQAFCRLGSKVTVLEALKVLPKDDPSMTSRLKEILLQEGIVLREDVKITALQKQKEGIQCTYQTANGENLKLSVSHVLVSTGRRANVADLNLNAAGIDFSPRGITVDHSLRTSNKRVYALGDCAVPPSGGYQFTHVAGYHAGLAIRNSLFKLRAKVEARAIPWVTYTDPELAHVGALEDQLTKENIPHKVLFMAFDENDRAQAEGQTKGSIKVLVSPKGYVLGATILGTHAGELIYPWVIMIQNKLKLSAMTSSIAPYPTLSDINKRVAGSYYTDALFSPFMKKIVRWIMRVTR